VVQVCELPLESSDPLYQRILDPQEKVLLWKQGLGQCWWEDGLLVNPLKAEWGFWNCQAVCEQVRGMQCWRLCWRQCWKLGGYCCHCY